MFRLRYLISLLPIAITIGCGVPEPRQVSRDAQFTQHTDHQQTEEQRDTEACQDQRYVDEIEICFPTAPYKLTEVGRLRERIAQTFKFYRGDLSVEAIPPDDVSMLRGQSKSQIEKGLGWPDACEALGNEDPSKKRRGLPDLLNTMEEKRTDQIDCQSSPLWIYSFAIQRIARDVYTLNGFGWLLILQFDDQGSCVEAWVHPAR